MSDRSAAPSPAASLREQIARAIFEAYENAPRERGTHLSPAYAYDFADAVLALPALREAAAPQVKGQHLLNPDSRLVNDPAFRFFILNFGCRSLRGEDAFACAGCQEDYSALRERIMTAAPAQVDAIADVLRPFFFDAALATISHPDKGYATGGLIADDIADRFAESAAAALRARSASPAPIEGVERKQLRHYDGRQVAMEDAASPAPTQPEGSET